MTTTMDVQAAYLTSRLGQGYAGTTMRNTRRAFSVIAPYYDEDITSVTSADLDTALGVYRSNHAATTTNLTVAELRGFFKWCEQQGHIPYGSSPMRHRRAYAEARHERMRVPADQFAGLIDSAQNPRDRIVVALGLYLLLRAGEIALLRVRDVNLADFTISVLVPKSAKSDTMPICHELASELQLWLNVYENGIHRQLRGDDYLVPAMLPPSLEARGDHGKWVMVQYDQYVPSRPYSTPHKAVQGALALSGYATHDPDGTTKREGVHTLRRSAARALFDRLSVDGIDSALRIVQSMLHHSSVSTTERYIGLDGDRAKRDSILRGERMFPIGLASFEMMPATVPEKGMVRA